jgi:hypothetical protein
MLMSGQSLSATFECADGSRQSQGQEQRQDAAADGNRQRQWQDQRQRREQPSGALNSDRDQFNFHKNP